MQIPIEQGLDFLKGIVDRSGMKSIVAGLFGWFIMQLTLADKVEGMIGVIAMTVICVTYFIVRYFEQLKKEKQP